MVEVLIIWNFFVIYKVWGKNIGIFDLDVVFSGFFIYYFFFEKGFVYYFNRLEVFFYKDFVLDKKYKNDKSWL